MSEIQLYDFQKEAVKNVINKLRSERSVCIISPTGSGKTVIGCSIMKEMLEEFKFSKFLFLVNLQSLVEQSYDTAEQFGLTASVIHDEIKKDRFKVPFKTSWNNQVIISMPETYINTVNGKNNLKYDPDFVPNVIFIDEAHKGTSTRYQIIRDMYPNALIVGLTATPHRSKNEDGEHLREWYGENFIYTISMKDLIKKKILATPVYLSVDENEHVVKYWKKLTTKQRNKRTIIFTSGTRHSFRLKESFIKAGISCEVITAGSDVVYDDEPDFKVTPQTPNQRNDIFLEFEKGNIEVLISVMALCEGFDSKLAKYCFLVRNVASPSLFQQMVGRVLRKHRYKQEGIIVDFKNNIKKHGRVEDFDWDEISNRTNKVINPNTKIKVGTKSGISSLFYSCDDCNHVFDLKVSKVCPHCHSMAKVKYVTTVGDIVKMLNIKNKNILNGDFKGKWYGVLRNDESSPIFKRLINEKFAKIFDENGNIIPMYKGVISKIFNKNYDEEIEMGEYYEG